jgi:hypothetical protein
MGTSRDADARIGCNAPAFLKGQFAMSIRFSRFAIAMMVVATILLMPGRSSAVYYWLGPSKDDWGIKYDVEASDAGRDMLTVVFSVADEGRLKPFDLIELIALNKETDSQGGHTYDVKAKIELKTTKDGRLAGQVQMRKEFADRAQIRVLTRTIDGKAQAVESYYEIPINKFLNKPTATASRSASRPE